MPGGNKRKIIITAVLSAVFLLTAAGIVWAVVRPKDDGQKDTAAFGVWWWEDGLCTRPEYLDFVKSNGVNEIYLCTNNFNNTTADFIRRAHGKGIAVYLLTGEYQYIYGSYGRGGFDALMARYLTYQSAAAAADMWNIGKEEVAFAKGHGRRIFLCASVDSAEGDRMGYSEEGRDFMTAEMGKLKDMADYDGLGIAVHHIKTWYDMPN